MGCRVVWVYRAVAGNCGKLGVLCSGVEYNYAGMVENNYKLRMGDSVGFVLSSFWVISTHYPCFYWALMSFVVAGRCKVGTTREFPSQPIQV